MVDCFSTNTEGGDEAISLPDVEILGLKTFCTFDKTFLCYWPFPWSVSANFPLDDNSFTLWQTRHRALVFCLSFTNQSLNCESSSQLSTKYFWLFGLHSFFLHNYTLALKETNRMNTELWKYWWECFSLDFIVIIKIFW